MSTAEKTARNFYETFHLDVMPAEVKRHLMILLLSSSNTPEAKSYVNSATEDKYPGILAEPEHFTLDEIYERLDQAEADMKAGRVMSCETLHEQLEQKFPWLCE
ncbi:MAG: hypothetical protein IJP75_08950 [Bacteroidaceae bacterium]|nr:hypothetical protein [Bacteroidaceae bacterium]